MMGDQDIAQTLGEIKKAVSNIPQLTKSIQNAQSILAGIESKLQDFAINQVKTSQEIAEIKSELKESRKRNFRLEKELKQTNLMFYGMPHPNNPNSKLSEDIIVCINNSVPNLSLSKNEIRDALRLRGPSNPRPILVKFTTKMTRDAVLRNAKLFKRNGISVTPDYTPEEREARKALRPLITQAISENRALKLRGTKIYIDNQIFSYDFDKKKVVEAAESANGQQPTGVDSSKRDSIPRRAYIRSPSSDRDSCSDIESSNASDSDATVYERPMTTADPATPGGSRLNEGSVKGKRTLDSIISPNDDHKQGKRSVRTNSGSKMDKKPKNRCSQMPHEKPPFVLTE